MAQNTNPIFGLVPNTGFSATITLANTAMDGTGSNVQSIFTAGANGSFLRRLRVKAQGTNQANVLRIFINNGTTIGTASNNTLWGELALAASVASNSAMVGPDYEYPMNFCLKAAYVIAVCLGVTSAAGWLVTAEGIDY